MKKICIILLIAIFVGIFAHENILNAQGSLTINAEESFSFLKILNEQKATDKMYEIIYSFEELTRDWNECYSNRIDESLCNQNLLLRSESIEVLIKDYILLANNPMLDTTKNNGSLVTLSLTANRLPTPSECRQILNEHILLKNYISTYVNNSTHEHFIEWKKQLQRVKELILLSINY